MPSIRILTRAFLICSIVAAMMQSNDALSCLKCTTAKCSPPEGCMHGLAKDPCDCCDVCAKGLGQECGGAFGQSGRCGPDLDCKIDTTSSQREGKCIVKNQTTTTTTS